MKAPSICRAFRARLDRREPGVESDSHLASCEACREEARRAKILDATLLEAPAANPPIRFPERVALLASLEARDRARLRSAETPVGVRVLVGCVLVATLALFLSALLGLGRTIAAGIVLSSIEGASTGATVVLVLSAYAAAARYVVHRVGRSS